MILFLLLLPSLFLGCPIPHCNTCSSDLLTCIHCEEGFMYQRDDLACVYIYQCPPGYYKEFKSGVCLICDSACDFCYGPSNVDCYTCMKGYFFQTNYLSDNLKKCVSCPGAFCSKCEKDGDCVECYQGFYLSPSLNCVVCSASNCLSCLNNVCTECKLGYKLIENICIIDSVCNLGTFLMSETCRNCAAECNHCFGPTSSDCNECKEGYFFDRNNVCLPCNPSCKGCDDDPNYCTSCPSGKVLRGRSCQDRCQYDEYFDNLDLKCKECDSKCGKCIDRNNKCTQCFDEIFYDFDLTTNQCNSHCPDGFLPEIYSYEYNFYVDTYFNEFQDLYNLTNIDLTRNFPCMRCTSNCLTCYIRPDFCTSCISGMFLHLKMCVDVCPKGFYPGHQEKTNLAACLPCVYPCLSCQDVNHCNECQSPFNVYNNSCAINQDLLRSCQKYEFNISVLCSGSCPRPTFPIGEVCYCDFSCTQCLYYIFNRNVECRTCRNASEYSYNGLCLSRCPSNTWVYEPFSASTKYCYDQCPSNLLKLSTKTVFSCVTACPSQFEAINGYCVMRYCPVNYYFTLEKFNAITKNLSTSSVPAANESFVSLFCERCHVNCKECFGKEENQCSDCIDFNYLQPKLSLSVHDLTDLFNLLSSNDGNINNQNEILNIYNRTSVVCLPGCPKGFINVNQICILCLSKCFECNELLYMYNYHCYITCPSGTFLDPTMKKCFDPIHFNLIFNNDNYISYMKDYEGVIEIYSEIVPFSLNCRLDSGVSSTSLFNDTIIERFYYSSWKIEKFLLQADYSYKFDCRFANANYSLSKMIEFHTFAVPDGSFLLNTTIGCSDFESFEMTVDNWKVMSKNNQEINFKYRVNIKSLSTFTNETIDFGEIASGINKNFKFPHTNVGSSFHLELQIFNDELFHTKIILIRSLARYSLEGLIGISPAEGFSLKDDTIKVELKDWVFSETSLTPTKFFNPSIACVIRFYSSTDPTIMLLEEKFSFFKNFNIDVKFIFPFVEMQNDILIKAYLSVDMKDYNVYPSIYPLEKIIKNKPYYHKVKLPLAFDSVPSAKCDSNQFAIKALCLNQCPEYSVPVQNMCFCSNGCSECIFKDFSKIICNKCEDNSQYIYNSICIDACAINIWIYNEKEIKICYDECPFYLMSYISGSKLTCVSECKYESENNYCFERNKCPVGYFFSLVNIYKYAVHNLETINYQSVFCFKCADSCSTCSGSLATECLTCKANYYFYKNECFFVCPINTDPLNEKMECIPKYNFQILMTHDEQELTQAILIDKNKFSHLRKIYGLINLLYDSLKNSIFNCNILNADSSIFKNLDINGEKKTFVLDENLLTPGTDYFLLCFSIDDGNKKYIKSFKTFATSQGFFNINPKSGFSLKDQIQIEIKDWVHESTKDLFYSLYYISEDDKKNKTLFQNINTNEMVNFNLLIPFVKVDSKITYDLHIFSENSYNSKEIIVFARFYYALVFLPDPFDSNDPTICPENEFSIKGLCVKNGCPVSSIAIKNICYCSEACFNCIFENFEKIQCYKCKNPSFYSYQGSCLEKCPNDLWIYENKEKTNFCYDECPSNLYKVIYSEGPKFYCKEDCLFESSYKDYCFNKTCPIGYVFTNKRMDSESKFSIKNFNYNEFFCEKCHASCKSCFGIAEDECLECPSNLFFYKNGCYESCPDQITIIDPTDTRKCKVIFDFRITVTQTVKTIYNFYSHLNDLEGEINIIDDEKIKFNIACNLVKVASDKEQQLVAIDFQQQPNLLLFKVMKYFLQPKANYKITCNVERNEVKLGKSFSLLTFSSPTGDFEISKIKGYSIKDSFTITIKNWLINEDDQNLYPLNYNLYLIDQRTNTNMTILKKIETLDKGKRIPFLFSNTDQFPFVDQKQYFLYELHVFNDISYSSKAISIEVLPFYKKVSDPENSASPAICNKETVSIGSFCIRKCPPPSFNYSNICYCDENCNECLYYPEKSIIECKSCTNIMDFIYAGSCFSECPKNTWIFNENNAKICYVECPNQLKKLIDNVGFFCVSSCTLIEENNFCFSDECPTGYFLSKDFISDANNLNNIFELNHDSIFCKKCHDSCSTCNGVLESNCINCKPKLFFYKSKISKCLETCPENTITDTFAGICVVKFDFDISLTLDSQGFLSYLKDIEGIIFIMDEEDRGINLNCSLNDRKLNLEKYAPNYHFKISKDQLKSQSEYNLSCIGYYKNYTKSENVIFKTYSEPTGIFNLNATSAYSLKDNLLITIKDWNVIENLKKDDLLFSLFLIRENYGNLSLIEAKNKNGFDDEFAVRVPYVSKEESIIYELFVFNEFTFKRIAIELKVLNFYSKVALPQNFDSDYSSNCPTNKSSIKTICVEICPNPSITIENICFCEEKCLSCEYFMFNKIECRECRNKLFYSYQGSCLEKCPNDLWIYENKGKTNFCYDECPSNLYKVIYSEGPKFYCKEDCLFESSYKDYCFNKTCPIGYVFTNKRMDSESKFSIKNFNYNEFFCEKCHASCKSCFGIAEDECKDCQDNQYFYKNKCFTECPPEISIPDPLDNHRCKTLFEIQITLNQSIITPYYLKFSHTYEINSTLVIIDDLDEPIQNFFINCNVTERTTNNNKIVIFTNKIYKKYFNFLIPQENLSPNTAYELACKIIRNDLLLEKNLIFQTFSITQGSWSIYPTSGRSLKDNFTVKIENLKILEDIENLYPFKFDLILMETTQKSSLYHFPSTDNISYPFPYVEKLTRFSTSLHVENDLVNLILNSPIYLDVDYYYSKISLTGIFEEKIEELCGSKQFKVGKLCLNHCPAFAFEQDGTCYCNETCDNCTFYSDLNNLICNTCKDQNYFRYQHQCLQTCPSSTWIYNESNEKLCFDNCPSNLFKFLSNERLCKKLPTYSTPKGKFFLEATEKTNIFNIIIQDFSVPENHDIILSYYISYNSTFDCCTQTNVTIIRASDSAFFSLDNNFQITRFNLNYSYIFPQSFKICSYNVELQIFNEFIYTSLNQNITVQSLEIPTPPKDDFLEYSKGLKDFVSNLTNFTNVSDPIAKTECTLDSDCKNYGTCILISNNHYCRCADGYKGIFCQYDNLMYSNIYSNIDGTLNMLQNNSNNSVIILDTVNNLLGIDIMDKTLFKKYINVLSEVKETNITLSQEVLGTFDKLIGDPLLKNSSADNEMIHEIEGFIDSFANSLSSSLTQNSTIDFSNKNINLTIKYINKSLITTPEKNLEVQISDSSISFMKGYDTFLHSNSDYYIQTFLTDSGLFQKNSSSNESFCSNVIYIEIKKVDSNNKIELNYSSNLINISIPISNDSINNSIPNDLNIYDYQYKYYDPTLSYWTTEGLTTICVDSSASCYALSSHLSKFAIFAKKKETFSKSNFILELLTIKYITILFMYSCMYIFVMMLSYYSQFNPFNSSIETPVQYNGYEMQSLKYLEKPEKKTKGYDEEIPQEYINENQPNRIRNFTSSGETPFLGNNSLKESIYFDNSKNEKNNLSQNNSPAALIESKRNSMIRKMEDTNTIISDFSENIKILPMFKMLHPIIAILDGSSKRRLIKSIQYFLHICFQIIFVNIASHLTENPMLVLLITFIFATSLGYLIGFAMKKIFADKLTSFKTFSVILFLIYLLFYGVLALVVKESKLELYEAVSLIMITIILDIVFLDMTTILVCRCLPKLYLLFKIRGFID